MNHAREITMKTTTLGKSGLHVSRIAFGTWQLGGDWGAFDENAAIETIRQDLTLASTSLTPRRATDSALRRASSARRCAPSS